MAGFSKFLTEQRTQINEDFGNLKFIAKNPVLLKQLRPYMRTALIGQDSATSDTTYIKRGAWANLKNDYTQLSDIGAVMITDADRVPQAILIKSKKGGTYKGNTGLVHFTYRHIGIGSVNSPRDIWDETPERGVAWLQNLAKFMKAAGIEPYLVYIMADEARRADQAWRGLAKQGTVPLPRDGKEYKNFISSLRQGLRGRLQDYIAQKVSDGVSALDITDLKAFGTEIGKVLTSPGAKAVQIGNFVYNITQANRTNRYGAPDSSGRLLAQFEVKLEASPATKEKIEADNLARRAGRKFGEYDYEAETTPTGYDFTLNIFITFDGTPPAVDVQDLRATRW